MARSHAAAAGLFIAFYLFVFSAASALSGQIQLGGGTIDLVFSREPAPQTEDRILKWVTTAARATAGYYGRFPVSHTRVRVRLVEGDRIESGRTFGTENGGVINISVGASTSEAHLHSDWMMTHEMVHLAFPNMVEQHHWIEEGLATYVEPIARARIGELTPRQVWSDVARDLPQGLPQAGDRGLDFTPTWGRTYWGGALFCLLADVEIRRRTGNAKGLEDALRGILAAGGSISNNWDLERAFRVGDEAIGVKVLQELYDQMRNAPHPVDLAQLWRNLGVERRGRSVVLHDDAPLAATRKAIIQER